MGKKPQYKKSKEEKARRALNDAIRGRSSEMIDCLKSLYMVEKPNVIENEINENMIHEIIRGIRNLRSIFFDLIIDEEPAKEILENSKEKLEARILPLRL
ncbi:MAG: hypothetical protein ABSH06_00245 [Thermodesulfobacteriota bacterium]